MATADLVRPSGSRFLLQAMRAGVQVMPFNWNGNHEFYEPLAKALSPISQLRVLGLDTERHDQTHFFLDAVKVGATWPRQKPGIGQLT